MLKKLCVGLLVLICVVMAVAGSLGEAMDGIMYLLLAVGGIVWVVVAVDAEDPVAYCAVTIAVALAAGADPLSHIHVVGEYLDALVDPAAVALLSGAVTILAIRVYNRLTG